MLRVASEVHIDRSPADVFAFATEVEKLPLWMTGVIEAKQLTDGPIAKGTVFEHVLQLLGKRFISRLETTEVEEGARLGFRTTSGPVALDTTITYEADAGGTVVRQVVEGDPRGFFKVGEPVLVKIVGRQLDGSLANLKDLLEANVA